MKSYCLYLKEVLNFAEVVQKKKQVILCIKQWLNEIQDSF